MWLKLPNINPFHKLFPCIFATQNQHSVKLNILLDIIYQKWKRMKYQRRDLTKQKKVLKKEKNRIEKLMRQDEKIFQQFFILTSHCLHFHAPPLLACVSHTFLVEYFCTDIFLFQYTLLISQWCMRNFAYLINPINAWEMKFLYIED